MPLLAAIPPARRAAVVDAVLAGAALLLALAQAGSQSFGEQAGAARSMDPRGFALCLLAALPLLWRRTRPAAVLPAVLAGSVALVGCRYAALQPLGPAVALAAVAERGGNRHAVAMLAASGAAYCALVVLAWTHFGPEPGEYALTGVLWAAGWLVGERRRLARERADDERERATRERRLAVVEERARIARELHDSAGHAINAIRIQAGAARLVHASQPERSREAIEAIEAIAAETVAELDVILGRVRDGEAAERAPLPGLGQIGALVERHRAAGLEFQLTDHTNGNVPGAVGRAAYRILQEALTNAARHGTGRADVHVEQAADVLLLRVSNPVAGAVTTRPSGGRGLPGMRERAALLGGSVEVCRDEYGFVLRAVLPLARASE